MDDRSGEALSQGSIFLYDFSYISLDAYVRTPLCFRKVRVPLVGVADKDGGY